MFFSSSLIKKILWSQIQEHVFLDLWSLRKIIQTWKKPKGFTFSWYLRKTKLFRKSLVSPWNGWFDQFWTLLRCLHCQCDNFHQQILVGSVWMNCWRSPLCWSLIVYKTHKCDVWCVMFEIFCKIFTLWVKERPKTPHLSNFRPF